MTWAKRFRILGAEKKEEKPRADDGFSFPFFAPRIDTVLHTPIAQSYMDRMSGAVQSPEGGSAGRIVKFAMVKVATVRKWPDSELL